MDVEGNIEFIIQVQARMAEWQETLRNSHEELKQSQEAFRERQAATERRQDRFDRQLNAIRKIIKAGTRTVLTHEALIQALVDSHLRTDQKLEELEVALQRLIQALQKSIGNGHIQ